MKKQFIPLLAAFLLLSASNARSGELLVFEYDGIVTKLSKGFVWDMLSEAPNNGNWVEPVNYAGGTFHLYSHVRSMPRAESVRAMFNLYQQNDIDQAKENENWTDKRSLTPGTPVTWSIPVNACDYKRNLDNTAIGRPIDYSRPRIRNCLRFFTPGDGWEFLRSDYGFNWSGNDPDEYFPMDIHFIVVVVAKGETFSGWDHYVSENDSDRAPPQLRYAHSTGPQEITLAFDEPVAPSALHSNHYQLSDGIAFRSASFGYDQTQISLSVSTLPLHYTLTLTSIEDLKGNALSEKQLELTSQPRSAFFTLQAENFDAHSGVQRQGSATRQIVQAYQSGAYLRYANLDFGSGVQQIELLANKDNRPRTMEGIELRLDSPDGRLIATVLVDKHQPWYDYHTIRHPVGITYGVHDLYVVIKEDLGMGGIDSFRFLPERYAP